MPGPKENKRNCRFQKLMCLKLQPKEKQALQKSCAILKKMDDLLEKIWYFSQCFLCNPFVLSFGCPDLSALSLMPSCKLSSWDVSGAWMGGWLEVPVAKVTGQEDTAEELAAGTQCSPTASELLKQKWPFALAFASTRGDFPQSCLFRAVGVSMPPRPHHRPCALLESCCCAQRDAKKSSTLNHYLSQAEVKITWFFFPCAIIKFLWSSWLKHWRL